MPEAPGRLERRICAVGRIHDTPVICGFFEFDWTALQYICVCRCLELAVTCMIVSSYLGDRITAIASDASSHHDHAVCTELQIHLNLAGVAIGLRIPVSR